MDRGLGTSEGGEVLEDRGLLTCREGSTNSVARVDDSQYREGWTSVIVRRPDLSMCLTCGNSPRSGVL